MILRRVRPCPRLVGGSAALLAVLLAAGPAAAAPGPTPTPTPRPRLSGGFGRTPAPSAIGNGQSMADVVKAAGASREKKEAKSGVAITNENLIKDTTKGHVSTSQVRNPTSAPRSTTGAPAPAGATPAAPPTALPLATTEQEAVWRDRAHRARQRVEELKSQVATLETETKGLENDFYRWDDGQYRDRVIKPAWDKKREELETAKRQLAAAEAELADLPEQARKAGALPGWLRE